MQYGSDNAEAVHEILNSCLVLLVLFAYVESVMIHRPLCNSKYHLLISVILIFVSQRVEVQLVMLFGTKSMQQSLEEQLRRQRGNAPTVMELIVVLYVIGFIWEETQEIYREGIRSYLRNMWNFIDFSRNLLYSLVALLRYFKQLASSLRLVVSKFVSLCSQRSCICSTSVGNSQRSKHSVHTS